MYHHPSSSISSAKPRGYRRRSRPARTSERTDGSTTARVDGKEYSSFRRRQKPSIPKECSTQDASIVIPFSVPSILTTNWLLKTAPIVLARHLIYARGIWPMSFPQLSLLQQEENNRKNGLPNNNNNQNQNRIGNDRSVESNRKRRRLNNENRINPSLRRKQQRAMDQITRLCDEWTRYVASSSSSVGHHSTNNENGHIESRDPRFLLILLGPSHGQARELFLLDFQFLIDENDCHSSPNHTDTTTQLTQEQEQKFETMLARKLISALMNHTMGDDERPSVANSLPAQTSPSFRLWFTAGFENDHISGSSTETDEPMTGESTSKAGHLPSPTTTATQTATASPFSTVSWIPRTKFPLRKQKSQPRPSSRNQSLVTIRFSRSQKQQNENKTNKDASRGNNNHITTASNLLSPTSEQLEWMSLSTCVKGFRL